MAQDNKKIYTIVINGVKESIESIEALKSKLDALDEKIEALHGVSIGNPMKGASSDMDDVAKKTEAVADGQSKVNQELIKTKDIIKDIAKDKEKLSSIKVDASDSDMEKHHHRFQTAVQLSDSCCDCCDYSSFLI